VLNRVDSVAVHCCHQVYRETPRRSTPLFRLYVGLMGLFKRGRERACVRANRSASFVCVSEGVARRRCASTILRRPTGWVLTIHNGVDTSVFAPGLHRDEARALRARLGIADGRRLAVVRGAWLGPTRALTA